MSKEIDWSKAPEGYPIWIEDLKPNIWSDMSGWHKEEEDRYVDEDGGFWNKPEDGFYRVYRNPNESWTGTGLPPVGTVCEVEAFHVGRGEWTVVEVLAHAKHDEDDALLVCEIDHDGDRADMHGIIYRTHYFRPIRTQAQIEAEEREKAIDDLKRIWRESKGSPFVDMYNSGYRKTEVGK